MSKAEKFIQEHTRNCSNEYLTDSKPDGLGGYISSRKFNPWLTPDDVRKAVEIEREELIENICMWLEDNISENCYGDYLEFTATSISNIDFFNQEELIRDLRKQLKAQKEKE